MHTNQNDKIRCETLCNVLDEIIAQNAGSIWPAYETLERFLSDGGLRLALESELSRLSSDPLYIPPRSSRTSFQLCETNLFSLGVFLVSPQSTGSVATLLGRPRDTIIFLLPQELVTVSCYHQPSPEPADRLDVDRVLEHVRDLTITRPTGLIVRAGHDVITMTQPPGQQGMKHVAVIMGSAPRHRFIWEYDPITLSPRRMFSEGAHSARLTYALQCLATCAVRNELTSDECSELALNHPDHFVRWEAIKTLLQIDFPKGVEHMINAENDPSELVRETARLTRDDYERRSKNRPQSAA